MYQKGDGLLKMSFRFVVDALNGNAILRTSVLFTVLCIILACLTLAAFASGGDPAKGIGLLSPRMFAVLFLPAEFLIYDFILGNPQPRATLKDMYLDWRLLRYPWEGLKVNLLVMLPALVLLLALFLLVLPGGSKGGASALTPARIAVLVIGVLVYLSAATYFLTRFMFLPLVVARRQPKALRSAFRETKGKIWESVCALFWPTMALLPLVLGMEIGGIFLEKSLGFAWLAAWFVADACVTGFLCCLGAAIYAFAYQRVIVLNRPVEPEGAATPENTPENTPEVPPAGA